MAKINEKDVVDTTMEEIFDEENIEETTEQTVETETKEPGLIRKGLNWIKANPIKTGLIAIGTIAGGFAIYKGVKAIGNKNSVDVDDFPVDELADGIDLIETSEN